jgi:predicted DNA-binding transcriptional regulator AlpA
VASPRLLNMDEVSEITRTPVSTLRYWRHRGEGPKSFKLGRRVVYREDVVTSWIEERAEATTSARGANA